MQTQVCLFLSQILERTLWSINCVLLWESLFCFSLRGCFRHTETGICSIAISMLSFFLLLSAWSRKSDAFSLIIKSYSWKSYSYFPDFVCWMFFCYSVRTYFFPEMWIDSILHPFASLAVLHPAVLSFWGLLTIGCK